MEGNKKDTYSTITLKRTVVFPTEKASLVLEGRDIKEAVESAHRNGHSIALLIQKNGDKSKFGVVAKIMQHWTLTQDIMGLLVEGVRRVEIKDEFFENGIKMAKVKEIEQTKLSGEESTELEALSRTVLDQFKKFIQMEGLVPFMIIEDLQKEHLPPDRVSDIISAVLKLEFPDKLHLLENLNVKERLEILSKKLIEESKIAQTEKRIQNQIEEEVQKTQKEYILRERLKAIEKELGITGEQKEHEDLEKKILDAGLPKDAQERVLNEFRRLKQMPAISPEVPYIRTYLDWVVELPWNKKSEITVDLKKAKDVLDQDHYGLKKVKTRILEYLAVQKLTGGKGQGSILCFYGPPGTGKTSVGQSIAKAVGRKFVRISLGGVRDEAEIRGHRRTYVGAMPGRIIQGIKNAGTKNPVFMMDEIDKVGTDFRGDPSSALLEVLDPAQNNTFSDHYIEIPFDLSEVFFITTANILDTIPPALRDRMEVIEFTGYTEDEKFHIAKEFLIPRVFKRTGLDQKKLEITDEAIRKIITRYTREAGVRDLERKLTEIARKIALSQAEGELKEKVVITRLNLTKFLGPEEFEVAVKEEKDEVGVSTGLAWTPVGGEIIFIEATLVSGKGNLNLTGQLGEVMRESARAALSYVRSRSDALGFDKDFYYKSDIHIHVPSGAIPKDGPSAGIAIATALASMLTKRKVKKEVALTGEITLSGKVLKVGGVKEKVLAGHRAGVKTIILPQANEISLIDIPETVKKELEFKFVKHMDQVLPIALM